MRASSSNPNRMFSAFLRDLYLSSFNSDSHQKSLLSSTCLLFSHINATTASLYQQQKLGNRTGHSHCLNTHTRNTPSHSHFLLTTTTHILDHDNRISKTDGSHPYQVCLCNRLMSNASNNGPQDDWKKNLTAPTKDARPKTEVRCPCRPG